MPRLALHLLGPPHIERDGKPLKIRRRKAVALLAYLAVTGEPRSRDALATLFWPEQDQSQARANLRRTLASLKKEIGEGWLSVDREVAGLDPSADLWLDVRHFQRHLAACHEHGHPPDDACPICLPSLAEAAKLYRDDFLAGFTLPGSPGFDDWQFFQTEGLRLELAGALERLATGHSIQGEYEAAIDHARRWVALDPLHEPAHRSLMRLYAWSGQRAAALRQYSECQRVLEDELSASPDEETQRLYEAIQQRRELPPAVERKAQQARFTDRLEERYRLGAEMARGGMGVVYRAYDTLLERDVAVKVVSRVGLGVDGSTRLLREAQAAAKLNHPNIVSVYDAGEVEGAPFIVMELVDGEPLGSEQINGLPAVRPLADTMAIARQVCAALEHAHVHGIVHRDLKPENVLIARAPLKGTSPWTRAIGTVKLVDFGLARPVASRVTTEGTIVGTLAYLAPELALGQTYDGRADLYSLGVMLYELTTGRLPFVAGDALAVISQHLHAPVVPPRAKNAGIPPGLDRLIVGLLSKDPADRPSSAAEVLRILDSPQLLEAAVTEGLSVLERIERGRMIGREHELHQARVLWDRALSGQGGVLLVSGEPGIGKTRLVRELVTQVQVSGGGVLQGACYAEGGVPYSPFAQILQQAVEGLTNGDLENLPRAMPADLLTLAPALRLCIPDTPPEPGQDSAVDDPQAEQHRLFESLALFFRLVGNQAPFLLVLEDAHWADSGTLFLLRHLARQISRQPALIVATYREVELDQARPLHDVLLDLQRERLATRLKLARLDREQTRELLTVLFDEEITPEFLAGIYAETEGNPFFIEEVCKALVESGKLTFQDGHWQRPSMEELGVPQSVRVAIQSRLRALPPEAQEALRLAALLGREFEFDLLAEASDQDEEVLIESLEGAARAQLIEKVSAEHGGTFALVHGLIATTLIENTRTLQRRQLHRRAAEAIEARRPKDASRLEALAYHYSRAGEGDRAADYLLQAGDRARGLFAYREALDHYQRAQFYLKEQAAQSTEPDRALGRAARTLMKIGLTYHNLLEFKAARQAYEEGFALWRRAAEVEPNVSVQPAPHALRVSGYSSDLTLDPTLSTTEASWAMVGQLFSGLLELTPELDIVPDVAQAWEVLEDGWSYIFHLRDDVRWSDGVPVTAGDFECAWRWRLEPAAGRPNASALYDIRGAKAFHLGQVSDPAAVAIHVPDPATLIVELEEPAAHFLQVMSLIALPLPRHVVEAHRDAWTAPGNFVSNGPFRLESWQPGQSLVLTRNPEYHGQFRGNIDRAEWSPAAHPSGPYELYQAGDLDVCFLGSSKDIERLRQRHAEDYISSPAVTTHYLAFDVSQPPFHDPQVRRALALAIDKEKLADVVMGGSVTPALGGLIPPGLAGHSPGIALPYDPKGARRLLAQAGYAGGSGFPSIEPLLGGPAFERQGLYLQKKWHDVLGIEIALEILEPGRYVPRLESGPPNLYLGAWMADYPDPDTFLRVFPFRRRTGWRNEAYDRLVADAKGVMDRNERMKLYQQADRILVEEVPIVPLLYEPWHLLVKPWVRKYPISSQNMWYWKDVILEPH